MQGMRVHGLPRKAHTDTWFSWLSNRDLHGSWEKHILCTNPEGDCRNAQLLPSKGCTLCSVQRSPLIHEDLRNRSEVELACVSQAEGKNTARIQAVLGCLWLFLVDLGLSHSSGVALLAHGFSGDNHTATFHPRSVDRSLQCV